jgi:ATP-binding cassette subfamily B protein
MISHNLLTVTDADQIIYIEHGRITETGTHDQLLADNRQYAHLYHLHHPAEALPGPGQNSRLAGTGAAS